MLTAHHIVRTRPRLVIAIVAGIVIGLVIPLQWNPVTRVLIGWNITVWSYLCLMGWLMMRASHDRVRVIAEQEDKGSVAILAIMSVAAIMSLAAIVLELSSTPKDLTFSGRLVHYAYTGFHCDGFMVPGRHAVYLSLCTRFLPVACLKNGHSVFRMGMNRHPDYWDFLYFSFTIAVAAQTSDVSVMTRSMRKTVLAQSILSFLFNVTILGLTINIAASLVGS